MNAQDLRNSILQLAIQGKLVEQRKEEGTAKELLERIKAEKEQLIKEKKIKKEKPLPEIAEDEIPFDIPENWEWVRLNNIALFIKAGGDKPKDFSEIKTETHKVPVIANGVRNNGIIGYTRQASIEQSCITVSGRGTIGFSCIRTEPFTPIVRLIVINSSKRVLDKYLQFVLTALLEKGVGTSIQQLTVPMLKPKLIPIPPLEEQKRIVAKIEELMPYIEKYGEAYSKLEDFNKKFPEDMQKSILQYAIQGKLVEQRNEEGTAEELYQQIQEEKARLIKEGKIKKGKPLEEITKEEIPFDIPKSWKWVRMVDVIDVRDGTHDTPSYLSNGYPLITGKDFYNGYFELSKTKYIAKEDYDEIRKRSNVEIGDIIFSMIGGNIGSMILINKENYFEMAIKNVALFKQYAYNMMLSKYLMYYLKSQVQRIKANANGGAQSFVPLNVLRNYLLPLPPLEEQKRIVDKIEELMPYCKQLLK